ncbi:hypothetical protein DFP72DRAFT_1060377 [Ephemerocybe angulata]|uniref:Protein-S-isoprenylcysteine O-methyltransferase n=1 Tax=Ephemerocybe angulata TaxID=980116 RepID=A0A8H6IG36_9AGAR|nr:hypothetical protein DFP72DRAFT_1060377 [Tulosesus angulatus]
MTLVDQPYQQGPSQEQNPYLRALKIPLLLVFALAAHVCSSPPVAPPSAAERAPMRSTRLEFLLTRGGARCIKVFWFVLCLVEVLAICSTTVPELAPLQPFVLRTLFAPFSSWTSSPSSSHPTSPSTITPPHPQPPTSMIASPSNLRLTPSFVLGCALAALGASIRLRAYRALGAMFTFEMAIKRDHRLVTSGPYAWVRHPGYTGLVCFVVGAGFCHAFEGSYLRESGVLRTPLGRALVLPGPLLMLSVGAALMMRMRREDEAMRGVFGKEWEVWARRVRWRLVPGVY